MGILYFLTGGLCLIGTIVDLVNHRSLAFEYNQLSTSMLQRKLQVGYARAGRIIDDLEERGIISGPNGSKPRQILITEDEFKKRE